MCERKFGIELEGYSSENLTNESFGDFEFVYDGSLENDAEDCYRCDGSGRTEDTCEDCNGSGREECSSCCGSGYEDDEEELECSDCGGRGDNYCGNCDGDGFIESDCEDCSGGGTNGGTYGIEAVSRPLKLSESANSIKSLMNHLQHADWDVNDDCGTHVHVDASDLSVLALQKLAILVHSIEPIIFGSMPDRHGNTYCKNMEEQFISEILEQGAESMSRQSFANLYYQNDRKDLDYLDKYDSYRYYGLNFHSYFYRGTVEFRYFYGMEDTTEILSTIDLCVSLVELANTLAYDQIIFMATNFLACDNLEEARRMITHQFSVNQLFGNSGDSYGTYRSLRNEYVQLLEHNNIEISQLGNVAI